ncbi:hypothetical protein H4R34_004573 [Dimargaris verticillata]|uniref:CUE domain-containing protein n=1 Tax=Dimargaris verticillata TaxID=2761393 RepID=A0A9W8E7Z8_9FUNG|nr:hypothetical protein H4R34_004573 [Dimargaris verticillata]
MPPPSVSSNDTLSSSSASASSHSPPTEELDFLLSCFPGWSADQLRSALTACRQDIAATVQHILGHGEPARPQAKGRTSESTDSSPLCSRGLSSAWSEENGGVSTKSTGDSSIGAHGNHRQQPNDAAAIEARYTAMQKGKWVNRRDSQHPKQPMTSALNQRRQQPSLVAIARGAIHSPSTRAGDNNHWHRFENDIQSILTVFPTVPRSEIVSRLHANGASVQDTIDDLFETFDFAQTADLLPTTPPSNHFTHDTPQPLGPGGQSFPPLLGGSKSAPAAASNADEMLVQLATIFPDRPVTQLQAALKRACTVEAAIDNLLGLDKHSVTAHLPQSPGSQPSHRSRNKAKSKPASVRQAEAELLPRLFAFKSYAPGASTRPPPSPFNPAWKQAAPPPRTTPIATTHPSHCHGPQESTKVSYRGNQSNLTTDVWDLGHYQSMHQHYLTKRNEAFNKAIHAFQCRKQLGRNSGTAFYYSQEGHRLDQFVKLWAARTARATVESHRSRNNETYCVDLHGVSCEHAIAIVEDELDQWFRRVPRKSGKNTPFKAIMYFLSNQGLPLPVFLSFVPPSITLSFSLSA